MKLSEWLYRYGWSRESAEAAEAAFLKETESTTKVIAAACTVHHETDNKTNRHEEMRSCVEAWLCDQLEGFWLLYGNPHAEPPKGVIRA